MFDALNGGIADLFGTVFEDIYEPAMLIKIIEQHATNGDVTEVAFGWDCFIHPLSQTQAYRSAAGLADNQLEVIVLASHLDGERIDTNDQIVSDSATYQVVRARLDGAKSQWRCVCMEKR